MNSKFQITTFEKFSQFSRVADRSILAGLTVDGLKHHTAHLTDAERQAIQDKLNRGAQATYTDAHGNYAQIKEHS